MKVTAAVLRELGKPAPYAESLPLAVTELELAGPGQGELLIRMHRLPEAVRAGIESIVESYGADEAMIVTITHDHGARRRSYELIAAEMGLRHSDESALRTGAQG